MLKAKINMEISKGHCMQVEAFGHSVVGADRDRNNDFFLVDQENSLFVVADGNSAHGWKCCESKGC